MSAAATAAGYLYASGRLRGRGAREQEPDAQENRPRGERAVIKKPVRVAALPAEQGATPERPKRAPRVEYRVRRWRPEPQSGE